MDLIIRPLGGHDPWFYEYAEFIEFGPVMRKKIAERDERKRQEYEKYLARVKERAISREHDNKLSVFIIVVILFAIFYAVSFGRQRQRAEEIRKQQQRAEAQQAEEDNRKKAENLRRQEQERYRQAEELRQQKQWADAHQAEENRRRAEELRRKEEELRRQAEEIKRQKERLNEELKNRRESQAKNIIYPRTLQEAFEVLGTHSGLTLEEYKKIFRTEVIKYHPDKTKNLGERLQKQAEEEMKAINMAWDIIKRSI
jgi:DnaJ-domain-containing protein 1